MEILVVIAVSLVVVFGMLKLADKLFLDKPDPPPETRGYKRPANIHNADPDAKVDLRYNPLAIDDDVCCFRGPVKIGPEGDPSPVSGEQVDAYLAKVREHLRPPSKCLVCGDTMKSEQGIETCDCPQRGYQPRS